MKNQPTPSGWTIMAGGLVVLIGSFLSFYEFGSQSASAWSTTLSGVKFGLFPVTIIPVLCAVVMALRVALKTFTDVSLPEAIAGFAWNQLHLVLGFQAAIMMLAYLLRDTRSVDNAIGFWLMLLGSIALAVGAVVRQREGAATP